MYVLFAIYPANIRISVILPFHLSIFECLDYVGPQVTASAWLVPVLQSLPLVGGKVDTRRAHTLTPLRNPRRLEESSRGPLALRAITRRSSSCWRLHWPRACVWLEIRCSSYHPRGIRDNNIPRWATLTRCISVAEHCEHSKMEVRPGSYYVPWLVHRRRQSYSTEWPTGWCA